jgi:hypothetical protein
MANESARASSTETIDYLRADEATKQRVLEGLADQLTRSYEIEQGAAQRYFADYLERGSEMSRLRLYYRPDGTLGGHLMMKVERVNLADGPCWLVAQGAAFDPDQRGGFGRRQAFFVKENLKFFLRGPRRRAFLKSSWVHPATFYAVTRHFPRCYPSLKTPFIPPEVAPAYEASFGARESYGADYPFTTRYPLTHLRDVGEADRARAQDIAKGNEYVAFFLRHNPEFHLGYSLNTLAPFTTLNVLGSALDHLIRGRRPRPGRK